MAPPDSSNVLRAVGSIVYGITISAAISAGNVRETCMSVRTGEIWRWSTTGTRRSAASLPKRNYLLGKAVRISPDRSRVP